MQKQHKILLIDDDQDEYEIFMMALQELPGPFSCSYANDFTEALNMLSHTLPNFIFLDLNMPKTNGFKCLSEIKRIEKLKDIPVVFYSNYIDEVISKKAMALGAISCIRKPRYVSLLTETLKNLFQETVKTKMPIQYETEN